MSIAVGLFGVSGVGKSTLIRHHLATHPQDRHQGGSALVKSILAPATVRDLDTWSAERQQAVRDEAIRRLEHLRDATPRVLLVDGHFTLRNRVTDRVTSIVTDGDRRFYDAYVLLDSTPGTVLAQTSTDAERARHGQDLARIAEHLEAERVEGERTARDTGRPLIVLEATLLSARLDALAHALDTLTEARC